MITGYRIADLLEINELDNNDVVVVLDVSANQVKKMKVSSLVSNAGTIEWSAILNAPTNIVQDASYVHTDNNYTAEEKNKLSSLSNYIKPDSEPISYIEGLQLELDSKLVAMDIGVSLQPYNADTVVDSQYVHTDNNYTTEEKNKLASLSNSTGEVTLSNTATLTNKTIDDYTNVIGADNIHYRVKNDTQAIILKGTIIKSNGFINGEDALQVVPTVSSNDVAIGITKTDIAVGGYGLAINTGVIMNVDTSTFPINSILYSAGNGTFSSAKPSTQFYQASGVVLRRNQNTGSMLVEFSEPSVNIIRSNITATAGQTTFSVTDCILGEPMVYVQGLLKTTGYSIINNAVVFDVGLNEGDMVNIVEYTNMVVR